MSLKIESALPTQIRQLEKRLKEMDASKVSPTKLKEITDTINNLKSLLKEKQEKKEQRKKLKEEKSKEVEKESAASGSVMTTVTTSPAAPTAPAAPNSTPQTDDAPSNAPDDASPSCALCGGLTFADYAGYQNHMEYTHKSDTMPTSPTQKLQPTNVTSEKEVKPTKTKFNLDQKVKPIRGSESKGRVMRHDSPEDLVYVSWDEGALKDRDSFGGYYPHELTAVMEEPKQEMPCPCWEDASAYCPKCKSNKTSDLKSNYMDMLKDLKDELSEAEAKHDHIWISKLQLKVKELEEKIAEKFGNEKTSGAQNDSEGLVLMDHTPPRANTSGDEIGKDTHDEMQDEWAEPARDVTSVEHFRCSDTSGTEHAGPLVKHMHGDGYTIYCDKHLPSHIKYNRPEPKTSSLKKSATEITVFNKKWSATPITKNNKLAYEITDNSGNKILSIAPVNGQEMGADHLKWAVERELKANYKEAKLLSNIGLLAKGTKVLVLAQDKAQKRVKIASLEQNIRAWISEAKIQLTALESQSVRHGEHDDKVLGASGTETLLDCVEAGPIWVNSTELLDANRPPATPESLNNLESSSKPGECPRCGTEGGGLEMCNECKRQLKEMDKQSAKECSDCHGNFVGSEGEACPTCGKFAVTALKTALPPTIPNERGYLNNPPVQASLKIQAHIRHEDGKWVVYNHDYTKKLGTYGTKEEATKRLRQIEYFKHQGSLRPFSKKAEVLTDPYQSLTNHITDMKSRMSQVQERLQSAPVTKAAGEEDNSKIDLPELFEDLTMGIDLLETKLGGDDIEPELHKSVEDLENLLWTLEEQCGITPKLNEHEKEEPEHKEVVEKAEEMEKKAQAVVTDETIEEGTGPLPALPADTTPAPVIQNVQPTDNDNLEVAVPAPTSPAPQGQKWIYNPDVMAYVLMPDPSVPAKQI